MDKHVTSYVVLVPTTSINTFIFVPNEVSILYNNCYFK